MKVFKLLVLLVFWTAVGCGDAPGKGPSPEPEGHPEGEPEAEPEGQPEGGEPDRSCEEMIEALCAVACGCRPEPEGRCAITTVVMGVPVTTFYDSAEDCAARHINLRCDAIEDLRACDQAIDGAQCVDVRDVPEGAVFLPEDCLP